LYNHHIVRHEGRKKQNKNKNTAARAANATYPSTFNVSDAKKEMRMW
jgi:hypothetical protein